MGAGFLIIQRAIHNESERIKREEAEEKEKIEQGYKRDLVMTNPSNCYEHTYRNLHKQQSGLLICLISLVGLITVINFMVMMSLQWWLVVQLFLLIIVFMIGLAKYFNTDYIDSGKNDAERREGCKYLKTTYKPNWIWTWVKKDK